MTRLRFASLLGLMLAVTIPLQAQQFGGSLAISGDQVLVGEASNGTLPGIVYVFAKQDGAWREIAQLMGGEEVGPPDGFGRALVTANETMLVGAPMENDGAGAVHVFRREAGGWTEVSVLGAPGGAGSAFGGAIALRGDVALIGAGGEGESAGAVYAFTRGPSGSWSEAGRLAPGDLESEAGFGAAMAFDGEMALVGTAVRRGGAGSVYAFRRDASGSWAELGKLEMQGEGERSGFGASLGLHRGMALVGAPNIGQRSGAVFVFSYDADAGWMPEMRLVPFDAGSNAQFGASIAFDGSDTWIGAPGADGVGAFHVFSSDADGKVTGVSKLASGVLERRASFGSSSLVAGNLAVAGAAGVDSRAGAAVIFERNPSGDWVESDAVINEMRGLPAITGAEVECIDDEAAGFECSNVNVTSFLPIKDIGGVRGTMVNDIWGWTDPQTGKEYAIVGRSDGTAFVDISDAYNPVFVADLPKTEGSRSSVWRDMKVYRDHVYIVADAAEQHGVQVFDLNRLRSLRDLPATVEADFIYDGIASAHNIVMNEESGYAYAVGSSGGGETCGGGLHMINLDNPGEPTFAGCFADPSTGRRKTGYSHDAQCVDYHGPDVEHQGKEICMGSNETALSIADVTDKNNPVAIAMVSYPNVAYTHQGWLSEDQHYFYQNDEGDEPQGLVEGTRTLVWDVTDLDDPVLVKEYIASTTTTDHNLYIRDNLMYQSNYGSGLRILDISEPENPIEIGFLDTTPYGGGGSWSNYPYFESGVIVATSMGDGLFVLKNVRRPLIP